MQARSIKGKLPEEVQTALNDCISEGFKPTLAIVFLSSVQDRQAICSILNQEGIAIYGATSNGEFTEDGILKESIAIMLMDIHPDHFTILFEEYPEKNYRAVTQYMAKNAPEKFSHSAFLIAGSHMETDAEELLHGFEDIIGMQVNVYGGMAGDDYRFTEQFVFTNEKENNILKMYVDETVLHFMNSREFESSLMANETVDATVAFIDICSFTALSENETPDKVVGLLNNYFDVMVKEIIGDEVNTAQRLQVAAEEGQILITELNYEKIKESFECSRVGNMNLKNMVKPIVIYEVIE